MENDDLLSSRGGVFVRSGSMRGGEIVTGPNFDGNIDLDTLVSGYKNIGFQGTHLWKAIDIINKMLDMREKGLKLYLGYTSNMVSSGLRDVFKFIVKHNMVDYIVTTAGGVEEDLIKCLGDTIIGDFCLKGETLRKKGLNRIGNLIVPNDNYCLFEDFLNPILDECLSRQREGYLWSPSKLIRLLGKEINNEESICYWAYKNNIPIFCPAITDGSLGDMIYFHNIKNPGLVIDIVSDIRALNESAVKPIRTGMLILGGGIVKHHICNANLMRNGADYGVFINTASEFDGSDAGASPDEAVSWGKLTSESERVKICSEATIVFPIIVSQTFAKRIHRK